MKSTSTNNKRQASTFSGRATVFASAAAIVLGAGIANAALISQTFVDGTDGGIVTFDDDLGGNQLRITFDNTSTLYSPLITGVVFNVLQDINTATVSSFTDGSGNDISSFWTVGVNVNNETTPGNTVFDIAFETTNGVNGGIYNDGVATSLSGTMFPDIATLVLSVTDPNPWALQGIGSDSILRMQQVGANGSGSLKIPTSSSSGTPSTGTPGTGTPGTGVPAPGTLSLLGLGMVGGLMAYRRRQVTAKRV